MQLRAAGMKNDHRDLELRHVLLEAQVAVAGDEDVEFLRGLFQQRPVFDSAPAHLLRGNGVVPGQGASQPPVEAFVYKNAHRSDGFQNRALACFDHGNDLFAFDRGEGIQEVFDGFTAFQVINQVLQWNARADKHGRAAHDFRVGVNSAFEFFKLHALKYSRGPLF